MLIKPFIATVNSGGMATLQISHSLHGLVWKVYQIGFGLGQSAPSPQAAAHVNGIPLASTVTMQTSAFANVSGQPPYAMESFFVGPPYILLSAGDSITCVVLGANPGDIFTAGAYIDEFPAGMPQSMGT